MITLLLIIQLVLFSVMQGVESPQNIIPMQKSEFSCNLLSRHDEEQQNYCI